MTLEVPGTLRIPVAVLVERRPGVTRRATWSWRAVEVLEQAIPDLPPWTLLREDAGGRALFLGGRAEVALHPTDTANYRDNLTASAPSIWVVLREAEGQPQGQNPGLALHAVTLDPGEAQIYADVGNDLLEALPLPPGLRATAEAFVAEHHREREVHKRRRDRADPQALARSAGGKDFSRSAEGSDPSRDADLRGALRRDDEADDM